MSRVSVWVLPLALTMSGCFLFTPPDVSEDEFDMSAPPSMDQGMEEEEEKGGEWTNFLKKDFQR